MKKIITASMAFLAMLILTGCTSKVVDTKPLDKKVYIKSLDTTIYHIDEICIQQNNKVIVKDFLPYVRNELKKHEINSKVYNDDISNNCLYSLDYSADESWDIVMYFKSAEMKIRTVIASVRFKTEDGPFFSKYSSMEEKFTPILDELLKGHTAPNREEEIFTIGDVLNVEVEAKNQEKVALIEKPVVVVTPKPKLAVKKIEPVIEKPIVVVTPKSAVKKIQPVKVVTLKYYIQVSSFSKQAPSKKFLASITTLGYTYKFHDVTKNSKTTTKVLVGPFPNARKAKNANKILRAKIEPGSFLVKR